MHANAAHRPKALHTRLSISRVLSVRDIPNLIMVHVWPSSPGIQNVMMVTYSRGNTAWNQQRQTRGRNEKNAAPEQVPRTRRLVFVCLVDDRNATLGRREQLSGSATIEDHRAKPAATVATPSSARAQRARKRRRRGALARRPPAHTHADSGRASGLPLGAKRRSWLQATPKPQATFAI